MKKKIGLYAVLAALVILAAACGSSENALETAAASETTPASDAAVYEHENTSHEEVSLIDCIHSDSRSFRIYDDMSSEYETEGRLMAGVVTHHLLAGRMISGFFKTAAAARSDDIETVVIVAPMHYPERDMLCTTLSDWNTDLGRVSTDREISERFIAELGAVSDDDMLEKDHSAAVLMPFVRYYFPEAKTACLLVSGRSEPIISADIAQLLREMAAEKNCLFVFSIDFSHYLDPDMTAEMDSITLDAVMSRDTELISRMTDDNLDTPRGMCAFIELCSLMGWDITELDHSDSLKESGLPYNSASFGEGLTSYFIFGGTEKQ